MFLLWLGVVVFFFSVALVYNVYLGVAFCGCLLVVFLFVLKLTVNVERWIEKTLVMLPFLANIIFGGDRLTKVS